MFGSDLGIQFRLFGIPIHLSLFFLILVVVIGRGAGSPLLLAAWVVVATGSVLLHEIGHALVARHYGIPVRAITLEVLGGYTEMETDSPHPRADLLVSVIGPIVSAVLGGAALAAFLVLPESGQAVVRQLAFQLAFSNLLVAAFNALPGLPLDGGRAVRALVWRATGKRSTSITRADTDANTSYIE